MKTKPFAARQLAISESKPCRTDFPGWPNGPRISNLPIRKMMLQSKVNNDGYQRSYKHPLDEIAMIDGDSDNELDFLMFAEVDPTVSFIISQPTKITFAIEDRIVSHVPDYALIRAGAAEIHEIKSSFNLGRPDIRSKVIAASRHIDNWSDWSYFVTSSESLRKSPLRKSITDLWRHHRRNYSDLLLQGVLDILKQGPALAADICSAIGAHHESMPITQLLSMAAGCRIFIDLEGPVGPSSVLRYPDQLALPNSLLPCLRPTEMK
jgi:hypothetical protein